MRKRLWDCQGMDYDEGGKLEMSYLLIHMRDLGNMIDGAKKAMHGEGPSGTKLNRSVFVYCFIVRFRLASM